MTSDVDKKMFVISVVVSLHLHVGGVLQQPQLVGGNTPAQPGGHGLGGGGSRGGGAQSTDGAPSPAVDQRGLERFDAAEREGVIIIRGEAKREARLTLPSGC